MLKTGDFVFDKATGANVQVLDRIEAWSYISYRVFNPSTGKVYKVAEEQLNKDGGTNTYDENYLRYVTLLCKIKNETAGGLLSSLASGVIPLPHQLHVLNRAMEHNTIRYILADEVGLGKTIEAGMVIKELKARGLVRRVLVVCPTGLVTQWAAEMQDKFHEKFNIILPSDFDTIRRLTDSEDVYGQYDQIISPMDSIKPIEKHVGWTDERVEKYNEERIYSIINSGWDLIVIDEAHRVAGSSSEVARYKLGYLLSQASPYLLLLSATPHNGKTEPFLRLVRLLDEEAFPNAKSIVKEQVAPYLIRTEKREAIDNNGNKLFKNRITHLVVLNWDERHTMQRELYKLVTAYVSKTYNKALRNRKKNMCLIFLLIIMQRMVTSSTAAVRQSLERRLKVLQDQATKIGSLTEEDLDELNIEDGVEEALEAISLDNDEEIAELQQIISVAKQAEFQHPDVKVETLLDTIDSILSEDANQKIIVFTEFVATQKYLQKILIGRGYTVSALNGSMSIDERNIALQDFRDRANIFISTDAGGEGLNLQFSNIIINYDLPWNPMKIEQRCGRADRIGQKRDVHIYNFIIEDTVENRVRQVLEEKLSVILKEMGVDKYSDVLDSEVAECDFTDVYMRSISHPAKITEALYPVESEMKQQVANAQKYKDVIREEKDLTKLVGQESDFDVESALKKLLAYYDNWQGKEMTLIDRVGINDTRVTQHLSTDIVQDRLSPLLSVGIKNFPNEAGFFMLWELSLTDKDSDQRIIPIFVNENFVLRPMAGKKIMDVFLDEASRLSVRNVPNITSEEYAKLEKMSMDFAFDAFIDLKDKQLMKNKESYEKYMYALKLRTEAAQQIGIENIRKSRIARLQRERDTIEENYKNGQQVYPDFRLVVLVKLEA
ncbi:MAG: DEAD/DEAH box helicase [Acidaminococcus provencensis]|jgi:ERCC4-related helicase|uniref:DEAD/DEAH box helicase n=1 Tax=Acidaminococcus provencensis TaxID=2058289 RepID=UPI0023F0C265|nr:helicase-related protein [Acidaminococcus provencensis]MCH4095446.1 DEAD/DEAH box helicase [Acidaminococcus provencensis]